MVNTLPFERQCLLAACLFATGCAVAASEEDHHLEHHLPEHKPATLLAAIPELERRSPFAADRRPGGADGRTELLEIIGWLPELAAETDLPRGDWERVLQISHTLQRLVEARSPRSASQSSKAEEYRRLVEQLDELAGMTDAESLRKVEPLGEQL